MNERNNLAKDLNKYSNAIFNSNRVKAHISEIVIWISFLDKILSNLKEEIDLSETDFLSAKYALNKFIDKELKYWINWRKKRKELNFEFWLTKLQMKGFIKWPVYYYRCGRPLFKPKFKNYNMVALYSIELKNEIKKQKKKDEKKYKDN